MRCIAPDQSLFSDQDPADAWTSHTSADVMFLADTSLRPAPGRLINRFTKDTEALDTQMSQSVNSALVCLAGVLLSIVAVAIVSPYILLFLLPLGVLYYRVSACDFFLTSVLYRSRLVSCRCDGVCLFLCVCVCVS